MIGVVDFLPILFERVILPVAVEVELTAPGAPPSVRGWIANPPAWLKIRETQGLDRHSVKGLDEGETAASVLAASLHAEGVLDMAAERGLVNFAQAIDLKSVVFRLLNTDKSSLKSGGNILGRRLEAVRTDGKLRGGGKPFMGLQLLPRAVLVRLHGVETAAPVNCLVHSFYHGTDI